MRLLLLIALLFASQAFGAACTPGTDCYCDKVRGGSLNDTSLLFCEDFEAPTLIANTGAGNGSPYYGPWYDATGQAGNRGVNSYWNRTYGNGVSSFLWGSGEPGTPTFGANCGFALCSGHYVWDTTDRWDGNAFNPQMAIYDSAADFTAEDGSLTAPTNTADGVAGLFDGNASLAWRISVGATHGIAGQASFDTALEIGMTMAIAYPVNSLDSGIWGVIGNEASWKHNEWLTELAPNCGFDGMFVFYNQAGPRSGRPFAGFLGGFGADCAGGHYSGSIVNVAAGNVDISADAVSWNTPDGYSQATDWPEGTWGCVRGHAIVSGGQLRHRVWFQGPNDTEERLLIDFTITTTGLDARNGWNGMKWNAYANTNQGGGYTASTERTFRYEDNVHVREGIPVSCAQIGFTGESGNQFTGERNSVLRLRFLVGLGLLGVLLGGLYGGGFGGGAHNWARIRLDRLLKRRTPGLSES